MADPCGTGPGQRPPVQFARETPTPSRRTNRSWGYEGAVEENHCLGFGGLRRSPEPSLISCSRLSWARA